MKALTPLRAFDGPSVQVGTPAMLFEEMHKDGVVPKRFNVNQLRRQFFSCAFSVENILGSLKT